MTTRYSRRRLSKQEINNKQSEPAKVRRNSTCVSVGLLTGKIMAHEHKDITDNNMKDRETFPPKYKTPDEQKALEVQVQEA